MLGESSNCEGVQLLWIVSLWDVLSAQRNWQENLSGTRIRRPSRYNWKNTTVSSWLLNTFQTKGSNNKILFPWFCANSVCQYLGKSLPVLHYQTCLIILICYYLLLTECCLFRNVHPKGYIYNGVVWMLNLYAFMIKEIFVVCLIYAT